MLSLTPLDSFLPFWLHELNATRLYKKPSEIVEFSCSCARAKKPTLSTSQILMTYRQAAESPCRWRKSRVSGNKTVTSLELKTYIETLI